MPATLPELEARLAAVEEVLGLLLPPVQPMWGSRTCKYNDGECSDGGLAVVVDVEPGTRATQRNGEGYCQVHATRDGITGKKHLKK